VTKQRAEPAGGGGDGGCHGVLHLRHCALVAQHPQIGLGHRVPALGRLGVP